MTTSLHTVDAAAPAGTVTLVAYLPSALDVRRLARLAAPVAMVQIGLMSMGVVDTVMVGRVSPTDLAAVALGHLYFFFVAIFGMGVLFMLDPVVSQAHGADDPEAVARSMQRGLILAAGLTAAAMASLVPAGPVLTLARQPAEVVPTAAAYTLGLIPGVFPFYGFIVLRQTLQAMGNVRPILVTVIAANLVNVLLDWMLIFGHLGLEARGAVGSAWATSLSRWFMMLALVTVAWPLLRPTLVPLRRAALAPAPLARMLRVGVPIGVQTWLEFGVFATAGLLMGLMGAIAVASHQVALQFASLTFMVPLGIAQATSVLVGQAVGRADPHAARRAAGAGLLTGAAFMALAAVPLLTMPEALARMFSDDAEVVAAAALLMPIAGVFQVFDGLQVVAAGALRGIGDTRVPMIMALVGFWFVGLPTCIGLGFALDAGPRGIWWGLATGLGAVAVLLLARIRRRFGRALRRLVVEDEPGEAR
jgi:MATE family multidrug resistance protein